MRPPSSLPRAVLVLAAIVSCVAPGENTLHEVPPPPLPELDRSSQEQYRALEEAIARGDGEGSGVELARAWGALAQWHEAYRFFGRARLAYENASSLAPGEPRWPYHLARLAYRDGENQRAEALWRRALDLEPKRLATMVRLAEALLAQGRDEDAEGLFRQAVAARPSCARARGGLAEIAVRRGDHATAAVELERAVADQPRATRLHYLLGVVYREQGRSDEAIQHLRLVPQSTLEHVPLTLDDPWTQELQHLNESEAAHVERGVKAFQQGRWASAETHFRRALAEDPGNLKARHNLALTFLRQDRIAEATAEMRSALDFDPGNPAAHNLLAMLLARAGHTSDAEAHFRAALATDPDHKRALYNLGRILLREERYGEALPCFDRAVELDPRLSLARHGRAVALWHLHRQREAIERLAGDRVAQPQSEELSSLTARFLATAAETNLRDGLRALALTEGASASGHNVGLAETRAMVLAELGRYRDAQAWQRAALTALDSAGRTRAAARARTRLEAYSRRKPCRVPWEPDELHLAIPVEPPS